MNKLNKINYKLKKYYNKQKVAKFVNTQKISLDALQKALNENSNKYCFLHGGLSQINKVFNPDGGLDAVVNTLEKSFDNIISPAYTFSFKKTGYFNVKDTKPEVGWFSKEFEKFANLRTLDPIHSMWIRGKLDVSQFDLSKTFSDNALYAFLDNENSSTISIGTENVMLSHLHYLEKKLKFDYRKSVEYPGLIIFPDGTEKKIIQETTEYTKELHVERYRLEYDMLKEGVLKRYDFGSLILRIYNNRSFYVFLKEKTLKNPYYIFYER
jgi:aminoglycoside N3'-acetyltransferase